MSRFLRTVGNHRANDESFRMVQPYRRDIPQGCLGAIPPWMDCYGDPSWSAADEGYDWPHDPAFRATRRYAVHRNPKYRGAA